MSIISVRLNANEKALFEEYAKFHGESISVLFKKSLLEKMENELDMQVLSEAKAYNKKHPETYTHEQIKQELGL